jgi:carbon-monoxide dehydrogenase large subunit/6-hydroxypseudooxynicotine dehydrogenase subunit gamma
MTTTLRRAGVVGASVERLEDAPLVTGNGLFAADINFPRQLHLRIVRSQQAHAAIAAIRTADAAAVPGVVAIWTAADLAGLPQIEFREGPQPLLAPFRQYVLARDRVRYVGEPVAAVFADDPYVAEDAAELVEIEADDLPVLLDATRAPAEFAPGLSTEPTVCKQGYGDIAQAFARSSHTVALDVAIGRHSGVPLETRGALGRYDAARDVLELHGAAKVPHKNREALAKMLNRPLASIHLFESHVGGGFGVRGEIYPEDVLVLLGALRLGRPVKWIEDRREHLIAANQSRQQRHDVRAAFTAGGTILGLDDTFYHDQGAYLRTHGTRVAELTCGMLLGPYIVPAYRAHAHVRLTNKTPAATYRAPGRYEANFVRERLMDVAASQLGISRIEIRRRNLIPASAMPYQRPVAALGDDVVYDSGDYAGLLDKALAHFAWDDREREAAARRRNGELVGLGLAMFVEKGGLGPTDGVRVHVDTSGYVEVITGGASVGQGFETVMAQVCADALGVDYRKVRVVHGRTDRIEYGIGAHASRATVMTANAVAVAAGKVRAKALALAAQLLECDVRELTIVDGTVVPERRPEAPGISLGELAHRLRPSAGTWGDSPALAADGWFTTDHMTYPYGVQLAAVRIDANTGAVRIEKALVAYDIGRAINPMLVRGQLLGGFVQGLGGALFEEFRYDESGQPLSVTFADYLLPSLSDLPEVDVLITEDAPSTQNPLGIKGAGEGGIAAVGALIASAVDDALGVPGAVTELPVTPMKLKRLIDARPRMTPA